MGAECLNNLPCENPIHLETTHYKDSSMAITNALGSFEQEFCSQYIGPLKHVTSHLQCEVALSKQICVTLLL